MSERSRGKLALEQLGVRLWEIKRYQARFSLCVLAGLGLWYVALVLWYRGDTAKANYVFTNSFQFLCVAWVCFFMLPYFLRVEAKQDVALAMGHDSVDVLDQIDSAIETRLAKLDRILERADRVSLAIDAGDHPLVAEARTALREMRDHMAAIRGRVERDTNPVPTNRRPAAAVAEISDGNGSKPG